MNTEVVQDGRNGYMCATAANWEARLRQLPTVPQLRQHLGHNARATGEACCSVRANTANFLGLFG